MSNRRIRQLVVLGVISIVGTLFFQAYWVFNTWQLNASQFDRQVSLALQRVAQNLADYNGSQLSSMDLVRRKSQNYYVVNTRGVIEPVLLEYFLRKQMDSVAIRLDYEYAIFDCDSDEMAFGKYVAYNELKPSPLVESLPKEMGLTYYFGVQFPTMGQHLITRMSLALSLSAVSVISLLILSFALYFLLKQKRLSELQKDFINNMTHEFKTPISTIHLASGVLAKAPEVDKNPRLKQYARIISEQNERLNSQVSKVLQLAKLERNTFVLSPVSTDLVALLDQVVESSQLTAEAEGGQIIYHRPSESINITADPFHTTNTIHNLLDNALKYARPNPQVEVMLSRPAKDILLEVKDNGPGIPAEYRKRITEKFFRVPTGNLHNIKGFGLGLYYVKKICEKHGWSFSLDCPEEGGTKVRIQIPG